MQEYPFPTRRIYIKDGVPCTSYRCIVSVPDLLAYAWNALTFSISSQLPMKMPDLSWMSLQSHVSHAFCVRHRETGVTYSGTTSSILCIWLFSA